MSGRKGRKEDGDAGVRGREGGRGGGRERGKTYLGSPPTGSGRASRQLWSRQTYGAASSAAVASKARSAPVCRRP